MLQRRVTIKKKTFCVQEIREMDDHTAGTRVREVAGRHVQHTAKKQGAPFTPRLERHATAQHHNPSVEYLSDLPLATLQKAKKTLETQTTRTVTLHIFSSCPSLHCTHETVKYSDHHRRPKVYILKKRQHYLANILRQPSLIFTPTLSHLSASPDRKSFVTKPKNHNNTAFMRRDRSCRSFVSSVPLIPLHNIQEGFPRHQVRQLATLAIYGPS